MRRFLSATLIVAIVGGCSLSEDNLHGVDLYQRACAICHGDGGVGGIGPAIDGGSNTDASLSDQQIAGVITVGPGNMPGYGRLSAEQVDSLVDYVRSLSDD